MAINDDDLTHGSSLGLSLEGAVTVSEVSFEDVSDGGDGDGGGPISQGSLLVTNSGTWAGRFRQAFRQVTAVVDAAVRTFSEDSSNLTHMMIARAERMMQVPPKKNRTKSPLLVWPGRKTAV